MSALWPLAVLPLAFLWGWVTGHRHAVAHAGADMEALVLRVKQNRQAIEALSDALLASCAKGRA
jgi:lipopolysaccharide biosynthesis regulator YciM